MMSEPALVARPTDGICAQPHCRTCDRLQRDAVPVSNVMDVIKTEFATIRAFLNSFTVDELLEKQRSNFIKYVGSEVVPSCVEKMARDSDAFIDVVANEHDAEITSL